ncbi:glycan-binding surface protein [Desertivirga arenae]|uniref:glycan-binding surface protein n=1 Tax=Desertivirga arenae TaxID=2810309 RepID=UPI001A964BB0|nr:glycan-binding surface protein [Pedobacter sp. SYSU D00823]
MKTSKLKLYIIAASAIFCSVNFSACKKEDAGEECNGTPVITNVVKPTDRKNVLQSAEFFQYVTIQGQNLCGTQSLKFNDVAVDLDQAFVSANEITVKIPGTIPTQTTNKVYVSTNKGEAQHDFGIVIPPLKINQIVNEYAPAGNTMVLIGTGFTTYGFNAGHGKAYFGNTETTITKVTTDSLFITVPLSAHQGDQIKIVETQGNQTYTYPYPYRDNRNILFDFDGNNGNVNLGVRTAGPVPEPISGRFLHYKVNNNDWDGTGGAIVSGARPLPADVVNNPKNYVLKFEFYNNPNNPFKGTIMKFFFEGGGWSGGNNYLWDVRTSGVDTRGEWKTITLPWADAFTRVINVSASGFYNNEYVIHGPKINADMAFDNFRIVPKQ